MKTYYLYILECADGLLYTGMTNNLDRRLTEHQEGSNPRAFTFKRRPVQLIFHETFNAIEQLIYYEKKIKKWSAQKKRALAAGDYDRLQMLSECRNATHSKYKPSKDEIKDFLNRIEV